MATLDRDELRSRGEGTETAAVQQAAVQDEPFSRAAAPAAGGCTRPDPLPAAPRIDAFPRDPTPWLLSQMGPAALRARRALGMWLPGDDDAVAAAVEDLARCQSADGSFSGSVMRTAGTLCLLADLQVPDGRTQARAADYLLGVLESQPGYAAAGDLAPGSLTVPWDLGGFFGPVEDRRRPDVMARGAREMNAFREFEPLRGPQSPVREASRSSLDRAGPSSCYSWGLVPLAYVVQALCRAGLADDARLRPGVCALLAAQRSSGGWCLNVGGNPGCTLHVLFALGAHPQLAQSAYAERALDLAGHFAPGGADRLLLTGVRAFALLQAASAFALPAAYDIVCRTLPAATRTQRRDGSFGAPHAVERAAAVIRALKLAGRGGAAR